MLLLSRCSEARWCYYGGGRVYFCSIGMLLVAGLSITDMDLTNGSRSVPRYRSISLRSVYESAASFISGVGSPTNSCWLQCLIILRLILVYARVIYIHICRFHGCPSTFPLVKLLCSFCCKLYMPYWSENNLRIRVTALWLGFLWGYSPLVFNVRPLTARRELFLFLI